jgi:peptidoglycan/LPS O-acetylase OafA/YrhL
VKAIGPEQLPRIDKTTGLLLIIFNLFLFCLLYSSVFNDLFTPPYERVVTYLIAILFFYAAMASGIQRVPGVLSFFADISYSLYLLHVPVGYLTMGILFALGVPMAGIVVGGLVSSILGACPSNRRILLAKEGRVRFCRWYEQDIPCLED